MTCDDRSRRRRAAPPMPCRASRATRDGPVFREPWEAQAFAMALALHERGVFTWREWAATLGDEIKRAQAAGDPDTGETYYRHWLAALERIVAEKGVTDRGDACALLATPGTMPPNARRTARRSSCKPDDFRVELVQRPRRAAVGARIVAAFQHAVGMQHHRAGMAHAFGVRLPAARRRRGRRPSSWSIRLLVEAALHQQTAMRRAPGAAEQPARASSASASGWRYSTWRVNSAAWICGWPSPPIVP